MALATPQDIQEDYQQLAKTRRHLKGIAVTSPLQAWSAAELMRCSAYVERWNQLPPTSRCSWQNLIVHLGDDPRTEAGWCTWSAKSNSIPTIRRSSGILAAPASGRHLLQKELYMAMGYPCHRLLSQSAQIPIYDLNLNAYGDQRKALGNSMHVASVGVFACCFLTSVGILPEQGEPFSV